MSSESALRDGNGAGFDLIETLRWEPMVGFVRLDRHLERLAASATGLGFPHSQAEISTALEACATGVTPLRVRLALNAAGETTVTTQPFQPLGPAAWTVALAGITLDAGDPLLRHKTTQRQVYDAARAAFPREAVDEVLLANQRGELCEGTITNIFIDDGTGLLLTPPLSSGLLPGVLRAELLATGKAKEQVLRYDDLKSAPAVFVGNSLRGLIAARLV